MERAEPLMMKSDFDKYDWEGEIAVPIGVQKRSGRT
jgi:hypothetical protein